jgi:acyl carrier protein phosphodiesterase
MVKIGNFMADTIHGHKPEEFPANIKKGILLHRAIDSFTDSHPVFRQSTKRLHPTYHHYAGVIVDIFYDHFLAKNWTDYHDLPLKDFAQDFYSLLQQNEHLLTQRTKGIMPHMINYNWLASYASIEGISRILVQMDHRTKNKSGMGHSVNELKEFYSEFEEEFRMFFDAVRAFSKEKLAELDAAL